MDADSASRGDPLHTPVLYQQVLAALEPRAGSQYVDGTVGAGGHAAGILKASAPDGRLLGLDRDPAALETAARRLASFGPRVVLKKSSFARIAEQARGLVWNQVQGVLLDLGLSSMQLNDGERGFSFQVEGPLDMRFDPEAGTTAADLVNGLEQDELADLIYEFGEEPRARRIARAIVAARPLRTTLELAEVILRSGGGKRTRIHPATRTFQALRIAVNDELGQLEEGLGGAAEILAPGGRLAVISFHSLEDRIVKNFIRRESQDCICPPEAPTCTCGHTATLRPISRKPVRPDEAEITANPRARSARLRVAEALEKG